METMGVHHRGYVPVCRNMVGRSCISAERSQRRMLGTGLRLDPGRESRVVSSFGKNFGGFGDFPIQFKSRSQFKRGELTEDQISFRIVCDRFELGGRSGIIFLALKPAARRSRARSTPGTVLLSAMILASSSFSAVANLF